MTLCPPGASLSLSGHSISAGLLRGSLVAVMVLSPSFWFAALSSVLAAGALFLFLRPPPTPPGSRRPPLAPGCHWLLGHLALMAPPDHHEPLRDVVDRVGPAFRVRLPGVGTVCVFVEGATVRHVLASFPKSPFCAFAAPPAPCSLALNTRGAHYSHSWPSGKRFTPYSDAGSQFSPSLTAPALTASCPLRSRQVV